MTFVDEHAEGVSPTLSAVRLYRAHRAAGRRGVPPDAPLDFAPTALQPLIRHNGETDRRRWESALFLTVHDEIQTGNLAIDGAKNFGRFEAFFLPSAQWEPVRNAFWARTGFPGDPAPAVEHLKTRLSDAFDRFLQGVPDNRQVVFDDDGWQLKTDPAEHPAPAHADSLVDLHRWLDTRSRSIRLADLLIEVENDLGFSVHFQRPGETRVDPGEVCALLAASLAHGCNLGLYTMEKVAPAIAYRRLKYVSDWRLVEENQRAALAGIVHGISRLDAAGHWATARRQPATGNASPCRTRCCSAPTAHASTISRSSSTPSSPTTTPRSTAARSSAPTATRPSCSTACSPTRASSTSKSTTPTPTATPRSTSPPSRWSACASARAFAACTASGSIAPTRPATTASSSRSCSAAGRAVNFHLIAEQWDRIGQFDAAFPAGHATASAALQRLNRFQASNRFYAANRELGRALKTEFVLTPRSAHGARSCSSGVPARRTTPERSPPISPPFRPRAACFQSQPC